MANRAYLYSSDQPDDGKCPEHDYYDSRWSIPLAWWFFFRAEHVVWSDVHYEGSQWQELKLSVSKDVALALMASRRDLLLSLLGGGLGVEALDQFVAQVQEQPGFHLQMDPSEVLGGMAQSEEEHELAFKRVLVSIDGGDRVEVLEAAELYVGTLGASRGGWECDVFGYTY